MYSPSRNAPSRRKDLQAVPLLTMDDNSTCAGFVKGLGQGLVGVAAQPVSGALDLLSSAFEGIDASSNTIMGKLSNQPRAVRRRRLPRAIGGDRKLQPFVRAGTDAQVLPPLSSFMKLPLHIWAH